MPLRKDIWRCGIACAPRAELIERGTLADTRLVWFPDEPPFHFLADPFGVWRDDQLHVFAEAYDYRRRVGRIDVLTFTRDLQLLERRPALSEPWHLSYPVIVEAEGETWMLPEAQRGGGLTLYRSTGFPDRWEAEQRLEVPEAPIDATPVFHQGRWWLFYCPGTSEFAKQGMLHAAHAPSLGGPWTPHPANPIRAGRDGSRPAGLAVSLDDEILLPVQDCRQTYGAAVRPLRITISPENVETRLGQPIAPPTDTGGFDAGFHTLNAAGPVTLFDVKRRDLSVRGILMEGARELRKLCGRFDRPAGRLPPLPSQPPSA